MTERDQDQGPVKPSEQRGGTTPDEADATSDGGPAVPDDVEPDLKDAAAARLRSDRESS